MDQYLMLRVLGCMATGWMYAKAASDIKPIVAIIGVWGLMICHHLRR